MGRSRMQFRTSNTRQSASRRAALLASVAGLAAALPAWAQAAETAHLVGIDQRKLDAGVPQHLVEAVAGDDAAVGVDQDRVGKAELPNAGGDLIDLCVRMGARVPGERRQRGYVDALDAVALGDHGNLMVESGGGNLDATGRTSAAQVSTHIHRRR